MQWSPKQKLTRAGPEFSVLFKSYGWYLHILELRMVDHVLMDLVVICDAFGIVLSIVGEVGCVQAEADEVPRQNSSPPRSVFEYLPVS